MKIEIALDSIEAAKVAIAAGADRLETCGPLSIGGVTPSVGLVTAIDRVIVTQQRPCVQRVMIRPRGGNFVYTPAEWKVMISDIHALTALNLPSLQGFVIGSVTEDDNIPLEELKACCAAAPNHKFTFHRAIDLANNESAVIHRIFTKLPQFDTILTSGGAVRVAEGHQQLAQLVAEHGTKIMPGSGVNIRTIPALKAALGPQGTGPSSWLHASCPKVEVPASGRVAEYGFGSHSAFDLEATKALVQAVHQDGKVATESA